MKFRTLQLYDTAKFKIWHVTLVAITMTNFLVSHLWAVYDFKYFRALPFGLFEFEDIEPDWILSWPCISIISRKLRSFNGHVGYNILRSHIPDEFVIALAIGLQLSRTLFESIMLMQAIWRPHNHRFHVYGLDLNMSCWDFTIFESISIVSPRVASVEHASFQLQEIIGLLKIASTIKFLVKDIK